MAVRDVLDVTGIWYYLKDLSSQHKGKLRCLSKIRTSRSGIVKSTVLNGISATENVRLNVRATERNKSDKNGKTTRQVYPAFFCGFSHPAVIDFHHPEAKGETKVNEYTRSGQWKRAYEEAEKCIPLCANCHRIHHWNERYE